jgi:hypothetical protein
MNKNNDFSLEMTIKLKYFMKGFAWHKISITMNSTELLNFRIESSMLTQTEVLPKPSYKELSRHPFLARITAQLEKNDHDNYCSDEECEYTRETVKAIIVVPDKYKDHEVGRIANVREYMWANHLPVPEVNVQGSGFCRFHKPKWGLGQHEYRYTIKKVEIVANRKYVKVGDIRENKKSNKNGYLVMASEGSYSDYENHPYGYSVTKEGAQAIANEAVCHGRKRADKSYKHPFENSEIIDLDTMKRVGEPKLLKEEIAYYHEKNYPEMYHYVVGKRVYYTNEEKKTKLNELYVKMMTAKRTQSM